jgi:hypothetical protein
VMVWATVGETANANDANKQNEKQVVIRRVFIE